MPQHPDGAGDDPGADTAWPHQPQHPCRRDARLIVVAADIAKPSRVFDVRVDRQNRDAGVDHPVDLLLDLRDIDRADGDSRDACRLHFVQLGKLLPHVIPAPAGNSQGDAEIGVFIHRHPRTFEHIVKKLVALGVDDDAEGEVFPLIGQRFSRAVGGIPHFLRDLQDPLFHLRPDVSAPVERPVDRSAGNPGQFGDLFYRYRHKPPPFPMGDCARALSIFIVTRL